MMKHLMLVVATTLLASNIVGGPIQQNEDGSRYGPSLMKAWKPKVKWKPEHPISIPKFKPMQDRASGWKNFLIVIGATLLAGFVIAIFWKCVVLSNYDPEPTIPVAMAAGNPTGHLDTPPRFEPLTDLLSPTAHRVWDQVDPVGGLDKPPDYTAVVWGRPGDYPRLDPKSKDSTDAPPSYDSLPLRY